MHKQEDDMRRIRPFIGTDLIKILICIGYHEKLGIFQAIQKELVASGVVPSQFIYLNFRSERNKDLYSAEMFHREISHQINAKTGKVYLFFDEIQCVNGWERCVNSFRVEFDCDIYIASSDQNLLSGEFATYLSGRYVEFDI